MHARASVAGVDSGKGNAQEGREAHVCTPAPTVWPTPCTPVLRRAKAPAMRFCTVTPPSSMRLASLSEADGPAVSRMGFKCDERTAWPGALKRRNVLHTCICTCAEHAGGGEVWNALAVSLEYLFHSASTEADGSSGPGRCPNMLLKKLVDMMACVDPPLSDPRLQIL